MDAVGIRGAEVGDLEVGFDDVATEGAILGTVVGRHVVTDLGVVLGLALGLTLGFPLGVGWREIAATAEGIRVVTIAGLTVGDLVRYTADGCDEETARTEGARVNTTDGMFEGFLVGEIDGAVDFNGEIEGLDVIALAVGVLEGIGAATTHL